MKLQLHCTSFQLFKKKLLELEAWLNTQEHNLGEENGRSVEEVEYLIQKHEQFQKKVELYEAKFQELVETTKVSTFLERFQNVPNSS